MSSVQLDKIHKKFGNLTILPSVDLKIEEGEFVVLVGPSGCGKSTLLRIIAGLEEPTSGTLSIGNRDVTRVAAKDRGVAMVFQNYALYPHMSVADNIGFSLKLAGLSAAEREKKIQAVAEILGITALLAKRPAQLSGGQKQRVAMGRAMVREPKVFLFDEPLSNLDAQLRVRMRAEIAALHRRLKATTIYVTHDQVEAMTLADRIVVLNQGKIEQAGAPLQLFKQPGTQFVASFIGTPSMNFAQVDSVEGFAPPEKAHTLGFRPDKVSRQPAAGALSLGKGRVVLIEPLGATAHVHFEVGKHRLIAEWRQEEMGNLDGEIDLAVSQCDLHYFNAEGTRL